MMRIPTILLLLAACDDAKDNDDSAVPDTETGSPSTTTPLEDCMASSGLDFECAQEGSLEWAADGEDVPCMAAGDYDPAARFLFHLDEAKGDSVPIRGLRLERSSGGIDGDLLEFIPAKPQQLSDAEPLPTVLPWPLSLTPSSIAAAFGFTQAEVESANVYLQDEITLQALMQGTTVRGTFSWSGGSYLLADADQATDDSSAGGYGCFHAPTELYADDL